MFKRLLPLLIIGIAASVSAFLISTKPKAEPLVPDEKAWLVAVQKAKPAAYSPMVTLYGRVESLWSSSLPAGIAAQVMAVNVIEGEHFVRDQVLIQLDDRDARLVLAQREADLQEAQARIDSEMNRHATDLKALPRERRLLDLARAEVTRLSDLVEKKVSAQSALDTARQAAERQALSLASRDQSVTDHAARLAELQARRAKAEAMRDQAALDLARCTVTAPFNGRVARVAVSPGQRVRIGDPLLEIYDTDAMVIRAQIPNHHLPQIRKSLNNDEPLNVVGDIDGQPVQAVLRSLAGQVELGSGGIDGLFSVKQTATPPQQGRFVQLTLSLPAIDGLVALPHEAIYGTDRVYIQDQQNRMRAVQIERVGNRTNAQGLTEVLVRSAALKAGTEVITTQLPNAIDGLLVRVATEEP